MVQDRKGRLIMLGDETRNNDRIYISVSSWAVVILLTRLAA